MPFDDTNYREPASWEPAPEPPPAPRVSPREEAVLLALLLALAVAALVLPLTAASFGDIGRALMRR